MWIEHLKLRDFRCHERLNLETDGSPWVVLAGDNGVGKTSLMEAVYASTRGRSFRRCVDAEMIRAGRDEATIFLATEGATAHRLGARYSRQTHEIRLDGENVRGPAQTTAAIPVDYMGGRSHRLVDGSPAARRRFLDWCLFHVEPRFLETWRLWHRAHRQRNEWLRRGDYPDMAGWSTEVVRYGEKVSEMRAILVDSLNTRLQATGWMQLGGTTPALTFKRGWREGGLEAALRETAERERRVGRAVVGPQYDDWSLACGEINASQLSRGQIKLASFYLWHGRAAIMKEAGRSAILLADDLLADLDEQSSRLALKALRGGSGQVWLAVRGDQVSMELDGAATRFHVEPGRVSEI